MQYEQTEQNRVKRGRKKASYDKTVINSILDANEVCTVAFNMAGKACAQPVNYGRSGDSLYLHGSVKNRMTTALVESGEACLSVFLLDAMKLTRSAYHHSVNYRSVVVFGKVRELTTKKEKLAGLKSIVNHFVPDRWQHCREPDDKELKVTRVLEITIESASAKIADNPPEDKEEDYQLDFWSGSLPIRTICDYPVADEKLKDGLKIPDHVLDFYKKNKNGF